MTRENSVREKTAAGHCPSGKDVYNFIQYENLRKMLVKCTDMTIGEEVLDTLVLLELEPSSVSKSDS